MKIFFMILSIDVYTWAQLCSLSIVKHTIILQAVIYIMTNILFITLFENDRLI